MTKLRAEESASAQAKIAACITALNTARAAAQNGGYYFAAAPTTQWHSLDGRPISPTQAWKETAAEAWKRGASELGLFARAGRRISPQRVLGMGPDGTTPDSMNNGDSHLVSRSIGASTAPSVASSEATASPSAAANARTRRLQRKPLPVRQMSNASSAAVPTPASSSRQVGPQRRKMKKAGDGESKMWEEQLLSRQGEREVSEGL